MKRGLANELRHIFVDRKSMSAPAQLGTYEKLIDAYARVRAMVRGTSIEEEAKQPEIDSDRVAEPERIID